jgi:hypothetical protein
MLFRPLYGVDWLRGMIIPTSSPLSPLTKSGGKQEDSGKEKGKEK